MALHHFSQDPTGYLKGYHLAEFGWVRSSLLILFTALLVFLPLMLLLVTSGIASGIWGYNVGAALIYTGLWHISSYSTSARFRLDIDFHCVVRVNDRDADCRNALIQGLGRVCYIMTLAEGGHCKSSGVQSA